MAERADALEARLREAEAARDAARAELAAARSDKARKEMEEAPETQLVTIPIPTMESPAPANKAAAEASPAALAAFLGSAEALKSRLRAAAEEAAAAGPDDVDMSDAELSPPKHSSSGSPAMGTSSGGGEPWATPAAAATPAGARVSPLPPTPATPAPRCSPAPEGAELQRFLSSAEALKRALRRALDDQHGEDGDSSQLQPTALVM